LSYLLLSYTVQPVFENYLRLFTLFSEHLEQEDPYLRLLERTLAVPTAGYWKGRYLFGKAVFPSHDRVFLGTSRIRDILISAVFPVFLLYALHTGETHLETQIVKLYTIFPSPDRNRVTQTVATQLFAHRQFQKSLLRTAVIYQGMLHLYKHYCDLPACTDCPLGDIAVLNKS